MTRPAAQPDPETGTGGGAAWQRDNAARQRDNAAWQRDNAAWMHADVRPVAGAPSAGSPAPPRADPAAPLAAPVTRRSGQLAGDPLAPPNRRAADTGSAPGYAAGPPDYLFGPPPAAEVPEMAAEGAADPPGYPPPAAEVPETAAARGQAPDGVTQGVEAPAADGPAFDAPVFDQPGSGLADPGAFTGMAYAGDAPPPRLDGFGPTANAPGSAAPGIEIPGAPDLGAAVPGAAVPGAAMRGEELTRLVAPRGTHPYAGLPGPGRTAPGEAGRPADPAGTQARGPRAVSRRSRRRGRRILILAAGAGALATAAATVVMSRPYTPAKHASAPTAPSRASGPTAAAAAAAARPGAASRIDSATTDTKPITLAEIFPAARVTAEGRPFVRVATAVSSGCGRSARGSFAMALTADHCQRVIRATYVDSSKRFAVTAGVAALPAKTLAEHANRARRMKHNVWFAGLDGKAGSGAQLMSQSGGYAYSVVDGRYIIFAYATYSDGHMPTGKAALDPVVASLSRAFGTLAERPITARAEA